MQFLQKFALSDFVSRPLPQIDLRLVRSGKSWGVEVFVGEALTMTMQFQEVMPMKFEFVGEDQESRSGLARDLRQVLLRPWGLRQVGR